MEESGYRIFLVEDDSGMAQAIQRQAEQWNVSVSVVQDFRNVLEEFCAVSPHLVLMDIGLPLYNGFYWCNEIRKVSQVPIMFLSSAGDNMNIVMAMNMGGDDFIAKPFDGAVLMAKVQALLRRSYRFTQSSPVLEHRGAVLELGDNTLLYREKRIELTRNEYRILLCLLQNKGKVVSRDKLMETLWQTEEFVDENTLTVNVGRLRKKLDGAGLEEFIRTKFGVGYWVE